MGDAYRDPHSMRCLAAPMIRSPNLSCDECSQLAAKVIPYAKRKVQSAPDRSLGHKHEVNRDAAQRIQASRENAVSMIDDHAIHA